MIKITKNIELPIGTSIIFFNIKSGSGNTTQIKKTIMKHKQKTFNVLCSQREIEIDSYSCFKEDKVNKSLINDYITLIDLSSIDCEENIELFKKCDYIVITDARRDSYYLQFQKLSENFILENGFKDKLISSDEADEIIKKTYNKDKKD